MCGAGSEALNVMGNLLSRLGRPKLRSGAERLVWGAILPVGEGREMTRVRLVGTVHEESGLVTVPHLLMILERIRPEVIFLEIPSAAFADYSLGISSNLESTAAREYRDRREVNLIPVDLPTPDAAFFSDGEYLFGVVERRSPDYCRLVDLQAHETVTYGFPHLNSERYMETCAAINEAARAAIEELDDPRLNRLYGMWTTQHDLRDEAMLRSIEEHSRREPFENGVLLVGAAHRQSMRKKLRLGRGPGSPRFDLDISDFLDPLE